MKKDERKKKNKENSPCKRKRDRENSVQQRKERKWD